MHKKSIFEYLESSSFSFILSHIPQNPAIVLSKRCLVQIATALSSPQTTISDYYCLALILLIYLNQHSGNPDNLEQEHPNPGEMASYLYILLEKLQGCVISSPLFEKLRFFLSQALTNISIQGQNPLELLEGVDDEVLGVRKELLSPKTTEEKLISQSLERLISLSHRDKPLALMEYLDFLCGALSIEEQILLVSKHSNAFFEAFLKSRQSNNPFFNDTAASLTTSLANNPKELFLSVHKFLDTTIYQYRFAILFPKTGVPHNKEGFYLVDIGSTTHSVKAEDFIKAPVINNEEPKIVVFEDKQMSTLLQKHSIYEAVEPLIDFLLRNTVLSKETISQEMKLEFIKFIITVILDRLWDVYPQSRKNMRQRLQAIFKEMDRENLHICQLQAGFLLSEKLKRRLSWESEEEILLKGLIAENPQIKSSIESFQREPNKYYKGPGFLKELVLKENCPLNQNIQAGGYFTRNLEVFTEGSILYWIFATRTHDIDFQISFLGSFDSTLASPIPVLKQQQLDTGKRVHRGLLSTLRAGIYQVRWDNTYSWFTDKFLRYRLFVLEPESVLESKSQFPIFNSCREILGLEPPHPSIKDAGRNIKPGRVKETIDEDWKWQKSVRIVAIFKENGLEAKGVDKASSRTFELVREYEKFEEEVVEAGIAEVAHRLGEKLEESDVLLIDALDGRKSALSSLKYVILNYEKVFINGLMRKFIGSGGTVRRNVSRKPIPFSRIMVMSLILGRLNIVDFSRPTNNMARCLMSLRETYCSRFESETPKSKEAKEIAIKALANAIVMMRCRVEKVIVNGNGLLSENEDGEYVKSEVKRMIGETTDMDQAEEIIAKIGFEVFSYEFQSESLIK